MLKINLLPGHIRERRLVPLYFAVCGVICLILIFGLGFYVITLQAGVRHLKAQVDGLQQQADEVKVIEQDIATGRGEAEGISGRVAFIRAVEQTGPRWANYLEDLARYVPADATLESWNVTDGTLEWKGRLLVDPYIGARSEDYMKFYIHLVNWPELQSVKLDMEEMGGGFSYPFQDTSGEVIQGSVPFTITGTLVNAPSAPVFQPPAAAQQAPAAGAQMPSASGTGTGMGKGRSAPSPESVGGGYGPEPSDDDADEMLQRQAKGMEE